MDPNAKTLDLWNMDCDRDGHPVARMQINAGELAAIRAAVERHPAARELLGPKLEGTASALEIIAESVSSRRARIERGEIDRYIPGLDLEGL